MPVLAKLAALGAFGRLLLKSDDLAAIVDEHHDAVLIDVVAFDESDRGDRLALVR